MNIIILLDKRKKSLRLSLGAAALVLGGALAATALAAFMVGGAINESEEMSEARRANALKEDVLKELKVRAQTSLSAMASRLSLLQSHVMRLDALGSRLADAAELEGFEFERHPGLGGPHDDLESVSGGGGQLSFPQFDFFSEVDALERALQDRHIQLSALETLLRNRRLEEQALPAGAPAIGDGTWVSSLYGYRTDPLTGAREFHQGVDFAGKLGTMVTAVADGIVIWSARRAAYGNLVEISHGNGYVTKYAHNKRNLVSVGQKVEKGEVIALMGNSGRSTGPHVHFEVVKNGKHVNPGRYLSLQ